jgi:hypothetical protein
MKIFKPFSVIAGLVLTTWLVASCTPFVLQTTVLQSSPTQPPPPESLGIQYYSPMENANYVSKSATIVVRYGPTLNDQDISKLKFVVSGSQSGLHTGETILADDHKTVIFKPANPFTPGEQVSVAINSLQLDNETTYGGISYAFTVAVNQQPGSPGSGELAAPPIPSYPPRSAYPDFLTVPQDIPHYTLTTTKSNPSEGYIFVAPFYWTKAKVGSYLLILNDQGQLVYYQSAADALDAWDFKKLPNGLLSYYDQKNSTFYLMDSHYQVVDTYQAGDGYYADLHELQILPNGNALLMAYDAETIDMSKYVPGGKTNATVVGLVIQELDPSKHVIFEWRSWDHFSIFDSTSSLTDGYIDLIHGNSLALANDGNLLLSSRNLDEVTKIDLQTGDVIWRLGGKENMFKFVNSPTFAYQHDVRQLPNGNLTVFDNQGTQQSPLPSSGMEYQLDEINKTVTQVWGFTHTPPVFGTFMGNVQQLADGNKVIGWGAPSQASGYAFVTMTEVDPNNQTVSELVFDQPYVSYRAFRYPWQGSPNTLPALAYQFKGDTIELGYSWNGATNVASYQVFGGTSPQSLAVIDAKPKTDFETQSYLSGLPLNECYFQVAALDANNNELARSQIISTDNTNCPPTQ